VLQVSGEQDAATGIGGIGGIGGSGDNQRIVERERSAGRRW